MADPAYKRAGFSTPNAYDRARTAAARYARTTEGVYASNVPTRNPEAFGAYYRAFVSRSTGMRSRFLRGGNGARSPEMRHYLVNVKQVMTNEEFQERYKAS